MIRIPGRALVLASILHVLLREILLLAVGMSPMGCGYGCRTEKLGQGLRSRVTLTCIASAG